MKQIQHGVCLTFRVSKWHIRKADDREMFVREEGHDRDAVVKVCETVPLRERELVVFGNFGMLMRNVRPCSMLLKMK
jgi:hypothetical protein